MTAKLNPVRIGLIGLGKMGQNHLRVLSMLRGVEIAFVFDMDGAHAKRTAGQYGVADCYDLDTAVEGVDALVICTPTVTHADYVTRFAHRVKALFVEKPLAHSLEAARTIEQAAQTYGTFIQVGFIERFNPAVVGLERVLRDAERVINIDFTRTNRLSSRITDVDVVMDLMIHDIDLALYLNGPVHAVTAQGVLHKGLIEFASVQLSHENGRFSRLLSSRITEKKIRLIEATCDDRFVDCDLLRKEIQIHRQSVTQQSDFSSYTIVSQQETIAVGQQEALLTEMQAFVQAIRGRGHDNAETLIAGVRTIAIAEAIVADIIRTNQANANI